MKLILAIIRIAKMNQTKQALSEAGLPSFTARPVIGRGRGRGLGPTYQKFINEQQAPEIMEALKALGPEPRLKPKRAITLVVTDEKKDLAIETIIAVNKTGNSGDGKIFVVDTLDAISVRTGTRGDAALA